MDFTSNENTSTESSSNINFQNVRTITTSVNPAPSKIKERTSPTRTDCEKAIKRILMRETLQNGKNLHFRNSSDFMPYFESLYPAGPSLQKQVQRAIKAMDLAKDKDGFFFIDRTKEQISDDNEIKKLFLVSGAKEPVSSELETVFLPIEDVDSDTVRFLSKKISSSKSYAGKFTAIIPAVNGIVFLTSEKDRLLRELNYDLNDSSLS